PLHRGAGAGARKGLVGGDDGAAAAAAPAVGGAADGGRGAALGSAPRVHLLGLVSDGGVHSSLGHLLALVELARARGAEDVVIHAFTDGRDTLPRAGAGFLAQLDRLAGARVGSVIGRYWAMDRDRRWDRTQRAYDLVVHG